MRRLLGLVMVVATGCGTGGSGGGPAGTFACRPAEQETALVAQGLVDPAAVLAGARAVALDPPEFAYTLVVAADVGGQVGTWALGGHATGARVFALDDVARRTTAWGAAVDEGSPPDQQRRRVAARPEVEAARRCMPAPPS